MIILHFGGAILLHRTFSPPRVCYSPRCSQSQPECITKIHAESSPVACNSKRTNTQRMYSGLIHDSRVSRSFTRASKYRPHLNVARVHHRLNSFFMFKPAFTPTFCRLKVRLGAWPLLLVLRSSPPLQPLAPRHGDSQSAPRLRGGAEVS
jgi:hypothetical protein